MVGRDIPVSVLKAAMLSLLNSEHIFVISTSTDFVTHNKACILMTVQQSGLTGDGKLNNLNEEWIHRDVHGKPWAFERFCGNMQARGVPTSIVPFRVNSVVGIKTLIRAAQNQKLKLRPSIIFLDSTNEVGARGKCWFCS